MGRRKKTSLNMKTFFALVGTTLAQTALPETLPFGEDFGEYGVGDYDIGSYDIYGDYQEFGALENMDEASVVDYFESADNQRSVGGQGGRKSLPDGVNYRDYIRPDGTFDVFAFRAAVQAARDREVAGAQNDERYFFTQPTTTSTTTTSTTQTAPHGSSCWKCDQMTYNDCAVKGEIQTCPKGDKDCCFVEVRETAQKLQQLCTGCKDKNACENLRDENFAPDPTGSPLDKTRKQCKPDYRMQYVGARAPVQSVCRQCFATCDVDTADNQKMCFGGSNTNTKMIFDMKLATNQAKYDWNGFYKVADSETAGVFGIPIRIATEGETLENNIVSNDVANTRLATTENIYMSSTLLNNSGLFSGKQNFGSTSADDGEKGVYFWGLHGADQSWWASDLKAIQTKAREKAVGAVAEADVNP